jgi:hypothetical protein
MADDQTTGQEAAGSPSRLYTLSEISQKTGISMPTLQRYKKAYQSRIPSVGTGRKQRYPDSALPVFHDLRSENAGRRGRPRKNAAGAGAAAAGRRRAGARSGRAAGRAAAPAPRAGARGRRAAGAAGATGARRSARGGVRTAARRTAAPAPARRGRPAGRPPGRPAAPSGRGRGARGAASAGAERSGKLLTLTQISETTGISYPTLVRYVRLYSDRLPHAGKGRARRFYPEAVEVFRTLRQESGRGGRRRGATAGRPAAGRGRAAGGASAGVSAVFERQLRLLEKSQQSIEKKFRTLVRSLQSLLK